ncbi:MAG: fibro-slime domain-containing protein [Planctomycetota bacterium]|nr:fibro-slime domain-containing protein [Planctomycetota bacterium]
MTYRDFTGTGTTATLSNPANTHPDFENQAAYVWNVVNQAPTFIGGKGIGVIADKGIVATTLGGDGKPVYSASASGNTTTGAANFAKWYNNDSTVNTALTDKITLAETTPGVFLYDSSSFFPIDGRGYGDTVREKNFLPSAQPPLFLSAAVAVSNEVHNWHFTMEMHTQFAYTGQGTFNYRGDDDLWVFIDHKLVIDLGGVHNPLSATFNTSTLTDVDGNPINLVSGQSYAFDLFFAERHRNASNFRMETSLLLGSPTPPTNPVPEPASLGGLAVGGLLLLARRRNVAGRA